MTSHDYVIRLASQDRGEPDDGRSDLRTVRVVASALGTPVYAVLEEREQQKRDLETTAALNGGQARWIRVDHRGAQPCVLGQTLDRQGVEIGAVLRPRTPRGRGNHVIGPQDRERRRDEITRA